MLSIKQSVWMNDLLLKPVRNISNTTLVKCYSNISLHRLVNSRQNFFHLLSPFCWSGTEVRYHHNPSWQHFLMQYCSFSPIGLPSSRMTTETQKTGENDVPTQSEESTSHGKRTREDSESETLSQLQSTGVSFTKLKWQKTEIKSKQNLSDDQNILLKYQSLQKDTSESENSSSGDSDSDNSFDFQEKAEMIRSTIQQVRRWCYTEYGRKYFRKTCSGLDFTVMSYNILSQQLLEDNLPLYRHCKYKKVLDWDYRRENLLKEIHEADPDIICLQELQQYHYNNEFQPELEKLGYHGIYKQKTHGKEDGCAVFYKKCLFRLDSYKGVEFYKENVKILNRDNIGLIVVLKPKCVCNEIDMKLCVATTHLLFNPKRGEIKLAQLRVLLAEIDKVAFKHLSKKSCQPIYHPVILCGDMNSEPFSPLYNFITRGNLECTNLFSGDVSGQKEGYKKGILIPVEELLNPSLNISNQSRYIELEMQRNQEWMEEHGQKQTLTESGPEYFMQSEEQQREDSPEVLYENLPGNSSSNKCKERHCNRNNDSKLFKVDGYEDVNVIHGLKIPTKESTFKIMNEISLDTSKSDENNDNSKVTELELYEDIDVNQMSHTKSQSKSVVGAPVDISNPKSPSQQQDVSCCHVPESMSHNFKFVSVYTHNRPDNQQEITTHHLKANCTVDYIFYSVKYKQGCKRKGKHFQKKQAEGPLRLIGYFNLMAENEVQQVGGLPNAFQSSDHLSLMARFLLKLP